MAVYLTKSMLAKMKNVKYRATSMNLSMEDERSCSYERWQKISSQGSKSGHLARDMICRVCAGSGCTPIVDRLSEDYDIITGIRSLTNIAISLDDTLPKYICSECLETLKLAMAFKRNCELTDRKFRQIMNPMGDPLLHTYPYSKTDFNSILHQIKTKRMKIEQRKEQYRQKMEKLRKKNEPKEKEFKCSPCDLTFPDKHKLAAHRRERQCMRRACDICGQLVLSISQHRRHIHKQSTPHKCPTCSKEFPILARLKTHMVVHSNNFNFYCDLCPYKCKHKYYLVMHMRTHTGEKPYKCPDCPSTFMNPSNLNKHKLTHQEKQYKCQLCEKAFRTTPALREHHEAAHMNIKHFCSYCGRGFCYKSDLRKHEIKTHNRVKRDYVGGEPTYKQLERLENIKPQLHDVEGPLKWQHQPPPPPPPDLHSQYTVDESKEYIYFSEVALMPPPPPQRVQQEAVDMLPEMDVKKLDDVKLYATPQGMAYFQG